FTPIRNVELLQVRHFGRCQALSEIFVSALTRATMSSKSRHTTNRRDPSTKIQRGNAMLKRALSTFAFVAALSFASSAACVWLLAISTLAQAQDYPSRAVTIISDSAAGSTPDAVLRVVADRLGQVWGQQVLAVNHPRATGPHASRTRAHAPTRGYNP